MFCISGGLQVTPLFRGFMFTAVIGRFRPVKLPFCIFGLADLTVSKVFFSSLPLRKEVVQSNRQPHPNVDSALKKR